MIVIVNFLLAEFAAYLTYRQLVLSPFAAFIPETVAMLIFTLPVIGLAFKRPFSFAMFLVLVAFNLPAVLSGSELFYALLDAVYYFGFEDAARGMYSLISSYEGGVEQLLAVTWLYATSEVLGGIHDLVLKLRRNGVVVEGAHTAYAVAFAASAALFYLWANMRTPIFGELGGIVAGIAGIAALFAALYLIAKGAEEEINSRSRA